LLEPEAPPLRVEAFDGDSSLEDLCKEILGLTKMN